MRRGVLIGVDEAGYGPNLGPLAIAATVWPVECNDGLGEVELRDRLRGVVASQPAPDRIAVGDSKQLYKPGGGIAALELAALAVHDAPPTRWSELVGGVGADAEDRRLELPWHEGFDPPLPLEADREAIDRLGERLPARSVRARLVFPEEFNSLVDRWDSKGAALSHATLEMVAGLIDDQTPTYCVCDKHGGRNRYAALLQHHFPTGWVQTIHESRAESRYRIGAADIVFRTGGEAFLPTAWASMVAKHLREVSMQAFNSYWTRQVPGVRPTAGYPVDAKRFKEEIATRQRELGIDDRVVWRSR